MVTSGAAQARSVVEQLEGAGASGTLAIGAHRLEVTNLDKALWPARSRKRALTKRDLLVYLARVSPYMLPHLKGRPVFVTRFPHGIDGKSFYQKVWEDPPAFVKTVPIWSSDNDAERDYLLCDNLPTLLWLGQLASLELHAWFSRVTAGTDTRGLGATFGRSEATLDRSRLNYPDFIVFDLDPYEYSGKEKPGDEPELHRRAFNRTRALALELREIGDSLGLETFVKTSGRTGLHLYLPIRRRLTFDEARAAAETIGRHLAQRRPTEVTLEWSVKKRRGKIFFDYNQNVRGKSLAAPFSPRRHAAGTVAMPITWDELETVYPTDYTMLTAPGILAERGDPWAAILESKGDLQAAIGAGGRALHQTRRVHEAG